MKQLLLKQNGWMAFAIIFVITAIGIYFRPILIIDETRYISVAWEMWDKGSFLVPLKNGVPYHHKPPLLFWLFHLDWLLFGVNEISVRLIPMIFGLGSLILLYKFYLALWKEDFQGAVLTIFIAAGTVIFSFYNSLIMFDVILTFFVLLGVFYIYKALKHPSVSTFVIISLSVGLGILAKGPVIVLHLFTFTFFAIFFLEKRPSRVFYLKLLYAFTGGIFIALAWAIPAGMAGGEEYRNAIFFGQTANRMVNSFAHQRSVWWYLLLLPLLLFPWSLYKSFYVSMKKEIFDRQLKTVMGWLILTLLFFSLISGKQIHYILPEITAFSIVVARSLTFVKVEEYYDLKWIGGFYLLFAVILALAPVILPRTNFFFTFELKIADFLVASLLIGLTGIYLISKKFVTQISAVQTLSLSTVVFVFIVHLTSSDFMEKQDLSAFSNHISSLQKKGITIVHDGKYHDQYQFYGRLHEPLIVLPHDEIFNYLKEYPNTMVITYQKQKYMYKFNEKLVSQKTYFKGKFALLMQAKNFKKFYKSVQK